MVNKNKTEKSSLKNFLSKPLFKADSNFVNYSGLGVQLAATILIFLFIGIWLDKEFNTGFVFTLIFTFIGFFGGFYSFYLKIKKLDEDSKHYKKDLNNK
jgi:ATP synthase protein I